MLTPRHLTQLASASTLLIAGPLMAHLTWRPLAEALGGPIPGVAILVSLGALAAVTLAAALDHRRGDAPAGVSRFAAAAAGALALGGALGGLAGAISLAGVALAALGVLPRMRAQLDPIQDPLPLPRLPWLLAWCAVAALTVATSVSLATYLGDPDATRFGLGADLPYYRHFCATAYLHAAELLRDGAPNVYDLARVATESTSVLPDSAAHMAPFMLDRYGYPPQFLLLPAALIAVVGEFAAQRAVIGCVNGLVAGWLLWQLGLWVGPKSGRVLRAVAPLIWISWAIVHQSGNVQLVVLALGVLAMQRFHARRDALGGAFLAGVTLAKIAPGLLGVLLLVQRRWRGVAWTVAFAVLFSVLALAAFGAEPFVDFLQYHLPKIASGEAYDFLDDSEHRIKENLAPFGVPFKLAAMGVDLDPWVWGPRVASAFTALVFGLSVVAGRRQLDRRGQLVIWLMVLTLAGLRSPMAPPYMLSGVTLSLALGASELRDAWGWAKGLAIITPLFIATPFVPHGMGTALACQLAMLGVIVWLMLRPWAPLDEGLAPHPLGEDAAPAQGAAAST